MKTDILIIGAGVAGLFTALKLAPARVTILTARPLGEGGSSPWAQGGVAAALAPGDSADLHARDTIAAGAGLVDEDAAQILCTDGPARIEDLVAFDVPFDREPDGALKLGREAAHSRDRVVHASGDQAGAAIMSALAAAARRAEHIAILERMIVEDLLLDGNGAVVGALVYDVAAGRRETLSAAATALATGGLGGLYAVTTNPVRAQGHGLAFAARAGAVVRDPEFVQFHPTALDVGSDPAPLATEALRGAGAILIDGTGRRFMADYHADLDLAPRDVVARAVEAERNAGRGAFLDARDAIAGAFPEKFPAVFAAARDADLDPRREPLPVAPACHYHMGGVRTDDRGRSSLDGLWAVGEVASSGVHGANRLASNSLLEALVFGARAAADIKQTRLPAPAAADAPADRIALAPQPAPQAAQARLRNAMSAGSALIRSRASLERVDETIDAIGAAAGMTSGLLSSLTTARLIVAAARAREESRGAHFRADYPETDDDAVHSECQLTRRNEPFPSTDAVEVARVALKKEQEPA